MSSKQLMNMTGIVHIIAEVILIGGVIFYFNKQVKSLRNEIKELRQKLQDTQEINVKHFNNIYAGLDKLLKEKSDSESSGSKFKKMRKINEEELKSPKTSKEESTVKKPMKVEVQYEKENEDEPSHTEGIKVSFTNFSSSLENDLKNSFNTSSEENKEEEQQDDKTSTIQPEKEDLDSELEAELNKLEKEENNDTV